MPIYEYQCQNCGEDFDMLRSLKDDDKDVECPYCHAKQAERQMSLTSASELLKLFSGSGNAKSCSRFG
jgi:putative FmdB family regulatory protein